MPSIVVLFTYNLILYECTIKSDRLALPLSVPVRGLVYGVASDAAWQSLHVSYNHTDFTYAFKSSSAIGFSMSDGIYDPNYVARTKESFRTTLTRTFSSHTR